MPCKAKVESTTVRTIHSVGWVWVAMTFTFYIVFECIFYVQIKYDY